MRLTSRSFDYRVVLVEFPSDWAQVKDMGAVYEGPGALKIATVDNGSTVLLNTGHDRSFVSSCAAWGAQGGESQSSKEVDRIDLPILKRRILIRILNDSKPRSRHLRSSLRRAMTIRRWGTACVTRGTTGGRAPIRVALRDAVV